MKLCLKSRACFFIPLLFVHFYLTAQTTAVWVTSSYQNIFKDTQKPAAAGMKIDLVVARNEFEAVQVLIRSDQAFAINGVGFSSLRQGNRLIAAANLSYNFVEYEWLQNSSAFGSQPITNYTRKGPGYFPDGLSNESRCDVPAGSTQAVWIKLYVPKKTAPGYYTGEVTLNTTQGQFKIPVVLAVQDVTIPDSDKSSFTSAMWMQYYGPLSWDGGPKGYGDLKHHFGCEVRSTKWWALMDSYAEMMKTYRSNDLPVNYHFMLIDGGSSLDSHTGLYKFNWSVFDKVIHFFLKNAAVKRLEGLFTAQTYQYSNRYMTQIIDNVDGRAVRTWVLPDSPKSLAWIHQFYPALKNHLEAKGWAKLWWQHIADEPSTDQLRADYQYLASKIRNVWPDIKLGDAFFNPSYRGLVGYTDLWVANSLAYDSDQSFFRKRQAAGDEVWTYTCNIPVNNYLNRFIDAPVWSMRLYMWNSYLQGTTGYLHWGHNAWGYETPGKIMESTLKGDNYIVKPDIQGNKLKGTIRYEAQRDGIEDYELLKILQDINPELARTLAKRLVLSYSDYSRDIALMLQTRKELVIAAAGRK